MGLIIAPNGLSTAHGKHEFFMRLKRADMIDVGFEGDPTLLIQMFYDSMCSNEVIAKMIITSTLVFTDAKNIRLYDLQKHSYITGKKP